MLPLCGPGDVPRPTCPAASLPGLLLGSSASLNLLHLLWLFKNKDVVISLTCSNTVLRLPLPHILKSAAWECSPLTHEHPACSSAWSTQPLCPIPTEPVGGYSDTASSKKPFLVPSPHLPTPATPASVTHHLLPSPMAPLALTVKACFVVLVISAPSTVPDTEKNEGIGSGPVLV